MPPKLRAALATCLVSAALAATPALAAPTANDASSFPPTEDISAESGAATLGFAPARSKTESADLGDADVLNNWVGVIPGEIAFTMNDGSNLAFSNQNLVSRGQSVLDTGSSIPADPTASTVSTFATISDAGTSRAQAAIDINHDGKDELAVITCPALDGQGTTEPYHVKVLFSEPGATSTKEIANLRTTGSPFAGNSQVGITTGDTKANGLANEYAPNFVEPNRHHLAAGDVNGDGYEDLVLFYYGTDGPMLEVFYFAVVPYQVGIPAEYATMGETGLGAEPCTFTDTDGNLCAIIGWHEAIQLPTNLPDGAVYSGFNAGALLVSDINGDGASEIYVVSQVGMPLDGCEYAPSLFVYEAGDETPVTLKNPMYTWTLTINQAPLKLKDQHEIWNLGDLSGVTDRGTNKLSGLSDAYLLSSVSLAEGDVDGDGMLEVVAAGIVHDWIDDSILGRSVMMPTFVCYYEWSGGHVDFSNPLAIFLESIGMAFVDGNPMGTPSWAPDNWVRSDKIYTYTEGSETKMFTLVTPSVYGWGNWALPLAVGNLYGTQNGVRRDQIFTDKCALLDLEGSSFKKTDFLFMRSGIPVEPRKLVNQREHYSPVVLAADIVPFEDDVPGCKDDSKLYEIDQSGMKDTLSIVFLWINHDGEADWGACTSEVVRFDVHMGGSGLECRWVTLSNPTPTDASGNPSYSFGNYDFWGRDTDAFYLKLKAHRFSYSEPVVNSLIQAPPYFQEVYDLAGGYDSGSTWLATSSGSSTTEGGSMSAGASVGVHLASKRLPLLPSADLGVGINVSSGYNDSVSRETSFTVTVRKGEDSVVVSAVPIDEYIYDVLRPGAKDVIDTILVKIPSSPVVTPIPVASYDVMAARYNEQVDEYNAKDLGNTLPHLPLSAELTGEHKLGVPESYRTSPSKLDTSEFTQSSTPLSLPHATGFGTNVVALTCSWKSTSGESDTFTNTYTQKLSGGFMGPFALSASESLTETESESRSVGTTYRGDVNSIPETYADYRMNLTMYAGAVKASEQKTPVITVGYIASDVAKGVAPASGLRATEVGRTSVTLAVELPFGRTNSASAYVLERKDASGWTELERYERPKVDQDTPEIMTFSHTDEGLTAGASYTYRALPADYDATTPAVECTVSTADLRSCTVNFPEYIGTIDGAGYITASGFVEGWAIDKVQGVKSSLVPPSQVVEGTELRFIATPVAGATLGEWTVTEDGFDISNDLRIRRYNVNGSPMLTVSDVAGDIVVGLGGFGEAAVSSEAEDGLRKALHDASATVDSGQTHFDPIPMTRTGWVTWGRDASGVRWVYFNEDGSARRGWLCDGGTWYYLDPAHEATMARGWAHDGSGWYLFGSSGAMKTGWQWVGGKCYYLSERAGSAYGRMAASTVVDGWRVGPDGAWVR